jgi:phosphate transport system protein
MLRSEFSQQQTDIDNDVQALFDAVTAAIRRASTAFLAGSPAEADHLVETRRLSASALGRVEHEVEIAFARQSPVASDLRFMLTVLRIVPQLDRCVELAAHIADRAHWSADLPPSAMASFRAMADTTARMWATAAAAWTSGDPAAAVVADQSDDELDLLSAELTAVLATANLEWTTAMETRLLVRFYERLGDHAVHVCERIRWRTTAH